MLYPERLFKKHTKILYYAKMIFVVNSLFGRGTKDTSIATGLMVPLGIVKNWRKLYEKGVLLKLRPYDDTFQNDYSYHDLKHLAKEFFEMGVHCRPISLYLNLPISTIYSWHGAYKRSQSEEKNTSLDLKPYQFVGEKFTIVNNRLRYSYETRQVAKECFLKGMSLDEIAKFLEVNRMTVYKWKRVFDQGRFYVNAQEELLCAHWRQNLTIDPLIIEKQACRELSELGISDERIALVIQIPVETVKFWTTHDQNEEQNLVEDLRASVVSLEPVDMESQKLTNGRYTDEVRQAAQEYFEKGFGYKFTAKRLGIRQSAVREWSRLYKEGRFKV